MNVGYDLEQLRRKIGVIEGDLDDARKRLAALEEQVKNEDAPAAWKPLVGSVVTEERFKNVEPSKASQGDPVAEPGASPPPLPYLNHNMPEAPQPTLESADGPQEPAEAAPNWKAWLQRVQLWPPADGQNNEVRLGAWWATRLGTLLAVIGVVFFGVYVSVNTPACVKFVELGAICGGVAVLGLWLERRIARFGAVVFAGGLALVYFCAFAGYALPAVKVLSNPAAAVAWQLAAVLLIATASVSRRSPTIATMAVGLGYVTAIFSRTGGLHDYALVTAALLAGTAVAFHRWLRWEAPSVMALLGSYAVYALVLHGDWQGGAPPAPVMPWLFLGGHVMLFFGRDWRAVRVTNDDVGEGERWFQGANSSLAVSLGVITALTLYRGELAEFYFCTAALLGMFSVLRRHQVEGDAIGAVLLAKATGAFTLGVIEVAEGRTTALTLLVQAWVMLFSARRLGSRVLAVGAGVVALVATVYFFKDGGSVMSAASWQSAGALVFVAGIAWLAAEGRRVIRGGWAASAMALEFCGAVVAVAGAVVSIIHVQPGGWHPALLVGAALVIGLPARWRRASGPLAAAGMLMVVAHASLWRLVESSPERGGWIVNAVAVLLPGVAHLVFALTLPVVALAVVILLATMLGALAPAWGGRHLIWMATWAGFLAVLFWRDGGGSVDAGRWLLAAVIGAWALPIGLHGVRRFLAELKAEPESGLLVVAQIMVALVVTVEALSFYFSGTGHVLACAVAALAVYALTRWPGIRAGLEASWVFWMAGLSAVAKISMPNTYSDTGYNVSWLVMAALLAWLPAVAMSWGDVHGTASGSGRWWRRRAPAVQTWIATTLAVMVCVSGYRGGDLLLALVAAVAVTVAVLRLGRVEAARGASVVLSVCACGAAWVLANSGHAEGWGSGLAAVLVVAGALLALPLVVKRGLRSVGRKTSRLPWGFGVGALGLVFCAALAQEGVLDPYATVGWGIASILVFMTGLFGRTLPYRMLGLSGLALCVPRVFLVDLDSALHRIAAFVVLGLVLLWVGFSYHRFRHFIADEPAAGKPL